jgi:hypothetical protein
MADTYTRQVNNTVRGVGSGTGIAYRYYPALAGAGAAGVALTVAGGPAWSAVTAVLAASTITTEFWFCGMAAYTATGAAIFEVEWYNATISTANDIAEMKFEVTATTLNLVPMMCGPYPVYIAANSAVSARIGGSVAKAINVHMLYALAL